MDVLLKDGTCGVTDSQKVSIGDVVVVKLHDENGNIIYKKGEIIDFL